MDDRVKFFATVRFDKLGKWQEPIIEAIHRAMPGAKATYLALPQGNVGLWITSSAFERLQQSQREERVREIISSLGRGVVDLLSSFHLYTPEEQADFDRTAAFNECFQALASRLGGPVGYRVFMSPQKHSVDVETSDGTLKATVEFADDFLDKIKGQDFHAVAGALYGNGLLTVLGQVSGLRAFVVSASGVAEKA